MSFTIYSANVIVGNESISTHAFKSLESNTLTIGSRDNTNGIVTFLANVGVHTLEPTCALHVAGNAHVDNAISTTTIVASESVTAATFSGSGASLTALNGSQLTSGTIPGARISGALAGITTLAASGTVTASLFSGNLSGSYANVTISASAPTFLGNVSGNSATMTGAVTAATFSGSGASLTALNGSQLTTGTIPGARISGALAGITTLDASGTVTASLFSGNLSGSYANVTISASAPTFLGNVSGNSATMTGVVTAATFSGSGASFTGTLVANTFITTGNVGVGTVSPTYNLHVVGNIYATQDIIAFSDESVKGNVRHITQALSKVGMLNGYTFDRTDVSTGRRYAGLLAQEVVGVMDECVYSNPNGTLALAYPNMCALLIEAVKELHIEVKELKDTVNKIQ
jgi:hypothetical protein